jgi:exodeoxyribonuclease VII small subunit
MTADRQSFEHSLRRLEQIVQDLERGDVPLEESIRMYEEGITISKQCIERLNQAEVRLRILEKEMQQQFRVSEDLPGEDKTDTD